MAHNEKTLNNQVKDEIVISTAMRQAVTDIKTAILQGQYEAAKGVTRIQLAVYFGIGKYVSQHTRQGVWGTGALDIISKQLRRELPGLRGYSATQLKNMRKFYENWQMLDANSAIAIVELGKEQQIDIYHTLQIPNIKDFPVEDFFRLPCCSLIANSTLW